MVFCQGDRDSFEGTRAVFPFFRMESVYNVQFKARWLLRYWNASASAGLLRMLRMQKSSRYDMDFGCCAW